MGTIIINDGLYIVMDYIVQFVGILTIVLTFCGHNR